jgi:hypothetical protein
MYCKPDLAQFDKEWELIPVKTRFDFLKRDRIIEEKKASYLVEWEEKNRPWTTPVYPTRAEILRRVRYKKSVEKLQDFFIKQQEYRVFEVLYESF